MSAFWIKKLNFEEKIKYSYSVRMVFGFPICPSIVYPSIKKVRAAGNSRLEASDKATDQLCLWTAVPKDAVVQTEISMTGV
jgi:hypothetical protein